MKKIFLLISLLFFAGNMFSQIDKSGETKTAEGLRVPAKAINSPLLISPKNHGLSKKNGFLSPSKKPVENPEKKEQLNMTTENGFMKVTTDFKPGYIKDKEVKEEYKKDSYLGDFKTGGKFVDIICRDHEFVDGDKVRVLVNDEVVENSITLTANFKGVIINLERGFNRIDIVALNQGTSGPNTAEFKVYDDKGKLLSSNEWNLATGAKATLIIVKD